MSSCSRLPTLLEDVNQIVAERDVPCLYHYCRFGIELGDVHSDAPILAHTLIEPLQKGGVPAAPSGTATLLRLSPSYSFYPRTLLAVTYFRYPELPCKARERIHRAMADARLLANPTSRSRVADSDPN